MTMKLNQILYQRSKDWLEKRPNTGILKFLEEGRDKGIKGGNKESFDDYLRGHIKTSNKSINIRGLFRVPNLSQGEQLMIHADEREEGDNSPIPEKYRGETPNEGLQVIRGVRYQLVKLKCLDQYFRNPWKYPCEENKYGGNQSEWKLKR